MKWFGSSGIRGVVFRDFTLDLASRIGFAVGSIHDDISIGRDARLTGQIFSSAVSAALMGAGADVCDVGIVTTPTLAYAARYKRCGVMVTASHNPPEYNGIKLWNRDGSSFDTEQMEKIESLMEIGPHEVDWKSIGTLTEDRGAISSHSERILSVVGKAEASVVVDCANGPASLITPQVLREMGCKVKAINATLDGSSPGRPGEPTEENLSSLMSAVVKENADLGIAHDGDADRMVAVDDRGRFVGGDLLLKIFAKELGAKSMVAPVDATMLLDDWFGGRLYRTRVGDAFVSEKVKQRKADFGGEPSGTWVFPKISLCPDGIFAAAKLAEICSGKRLSELVDRTPSLPMIKETIKFDQSKKRTIQSALEKSISSMRSVEVDSTDGFRLRYEDGWALIRLSGTEPKMRIVVEARSSDRAKAIMESMKEIARRALS